VKAGLAEPANNFEIRISNTETNPNDKNPVQREQGVFTHRSPANRAGRNAAVDEPAFDT